MIKVAIAGAPDTGKTTLAKYVSAILSAESIHCEYISEYAQEHISMYGPIPLSAQARVFYYQLEREQVLSLDAKVLVTDSPVFLSYIYGLYNARTEAERVSLDVILGSVRGNAYDLVFYLPPRGLPRKGIKDQTYNLERVDSLLQGYLKLFVEQYVTLQPGHIDVMAGIIIAKIKELCNEKS